MGGFLLLLIMLRKCGTRMSTNIRMDMVMEKALVPLQNAPLVHWLEYKTLLQQVCEIYGMKDRSKGIDEGVKLGITHLLADGLSEAGSHAQDFALVRNRERKIGNRKINGPAHQVKVAKRTLFPRLDTATHVKKEKGSDF